MKRFPNEIEFEWPGKLRLSARGLPAVVCAIGVTAVAVFVLLRYVLIH